jgi:tripartite-type tricarboxylate transporter receptor subunit TctC
MRLGRRALLATPLALAAPARAQAPSWPSRPVRILVPYPAGGGTDILARAVADSLRPRLPQPIVVENRPGAQGAIGSEQVARSEPDGHTLLVVTSTHNLNKYQLQQIPYDPLRDFAPVAVMTRQILVLVAGVNQPFQDVQGLVAQARARPGGIGFGATEAVTAWAGHEFNRRAGVRTEEVQYRGGGLLMNDIVAGHLPIGWTSTASAIPHLQTGKVRVLAVSTPQRTRLLPEVPTVQESGVPGYDVSGWVAMLGPAALPASLAARIHGMLAEAYADPALQARFQALGLEADLRDPAASAEFLKADDARWAAAAAAGQVVKVQ